MSEVGDIVNVVVIVESCFGNTAAVANEAVAALVEAGATVEVLAAQDAPNSVRADLILVGAAEQGSRDELERTRVIRRSVTQGLRGQRPAGHSQDAGNKQRAQHPQAASRVHDFDRAGAPRSDRRRCR